MHFKNIDLFSPQTKRTRSARSPSSSINRFSAFTLFKILRPRMIAHDENRHDGSIDILLTGCEVSLWVGEQFASDLHNAFPKLKVECLSANKLLAQLGSAYPIPNTGFKFNAQSWDLSNTIVLLLSHSGGTFATLNVSYLLKGVTSNLFVITSEWDTKIAHSVRNGKPGKNRFELRSYVFITFCGLRSSEPCSLTPVAMHQVKPKRVCA